jgi:CRISPR system Cascade subunit CasE
VPFLSKIRINPLREKGRRILGNPHLAHAMIMGGIAAQPVAERILWRIDAANPRQPDLLVLTQSKPDWTHIVEQAGWPHAEGDHVLVRDYEPLLRHLAVGREYAFKLTANPVQNTLNPLRSSTQQRERRTKGETRAFRVPHTTIAHQNEWLLRKLPHLGFTIPQIAITGPAPGIGAPATALPTTANREQSAENHATYGDQAVIRDVTITARDRLSFTKNASYTGPRVSLATATYQGRLRVTDADLLRDKLLTGIGPAKAYGCGLLTLAPLPAEHHG